MTKFSDSVEDVFGLKSKDDDIKNEVTVIENDHLPVDAESTAKVSEIQDDYEFARENMYKLIRDGGEALENLILVARDAEDSKTYDAVTNMIKVLADVNKGLFDIQKNSIESKKMSEGESGPSVVKNVTNNNLKLTTEQVSEMLEKKRKEKEE